MAQAASVGMATPSVNFRVTHRTSPSAPLRVSDPPPSLTQSPTSTSASWPDAASSMTRMFSVADTHDRISTRASDLPLRYVDIVTAS